MTLAFFQTEGKVPVCSDRLNNDVNEGTIVCPESLSRRALILSNPIALLGFKRLTVVLLLPFSDFLTLSLIQGLFSWTQETLYKSFHMFRILHALIPLISMWVLIILPGNVMSRTMHYVNYLIFNYIVIDGCDYVLLQTCGNSLRKCCWNSGGPSDILLV